jgi:LytS/YehU family sensor histidine kinase
MKKLAIWHIAVWLVLLSFFLVPVYFSGLSAKVLYAIVSFLIYISAFSINIIFILPRFVRIRKVINLLASWFLMILIYTVISILLHRVFHLFERGGKLGLEVVNTFLVNFFWVSIFLGVSTAYQSIIDWFKNERIKQQLENQNLKTELAFLKSQINPHFLFNTLNNIYILAYKQSDQTSEAILKLSEMMRYMLYESSNDLVFVQKEIDIIRQLISLQQLRTKESLCFEFQTMGIEEQNKIAPLILISFVENIFKHGTLNDCNDPAVVQVHVEDNNLTFDSRNKINRQAKDNTTGIGLPNVKRRLELLYPGSYDFTITNDETHYSIHLRLQLN